MSTTAQNAIASQKMTGFWLRVTLGKCGASDPVRRPTVRNVAKTASIKTPIQPVHIAMRTREVATTTHKMRNCWSFTA
jgi:hypothetical protein